MLRSLVGSEMCIRDSSHVNVLIAEWLTAHLINVVPAPPRVLFVCRANSCRSQMAEGWLRSMVPGSWVVASAGLRQSSVNPNAAVVMGEAGVGIEDHRSDAISAFSPQEWDQVISLCGCGESLPEGWVATQDWNLDDPPALDTGDLSVYRRVRNEIRERCLLPVSYTHLTLPTKRIV
eukprot:TRINITY_DN61475_c0_g1_i1.p1 TRINITY_DN61475_c0_g1~~TRINITY_DN61475_c0_g1_i1.p1  ORF type:complete len:177 (-),score=40.44 TRINITY_DN61475_c0_g1_i1:133-663(-)